MLLSAVEYDKEQVERAIRLAQEAFPGEIEHIRYSAGDDWAQEPSLFFRVLLTDKNRLFERLRSEDPAVQREVTVLCKDIIDTITASLKSDGYQPYFRFRTVAEQRKLRDANWE